MAHSNKMMIREDNKKSKTGRAREKQVEKVYKK